MKLRAITETAGSELTLYKGVSDASGLRNWPVREVGEIGVYIPGFLSTLKIGWVYSEPTLTGSSDQNGMVAEFKIDSKSVINRTEQFIEWCDRRGKKSYDVSCGFPLEWREDSSIWTVCDSGSGHAGVSCFGNASFVYCGIPASYKVIAFFNNQNDWKMDSTNPLKRL